jgi:hypothetical protein
MCFPLLAPPHPPILIPSLSLIRVPPPSQAPRLASLLAPRAASPHSRAAPSTPSMPHVASMPPFARLPAPRAAPLASPAPRADLATPALSTSGHRFADPTLVYHRRGSAPPSVPTDPGPLTSAARFTDPAVVYHRCGPAMPMAPKPSVYHPVAIHRAPGTITPW